jgi:hypothetical protein
MQPSLWSLGAEPLGLDVLDDEAALLAALPSIFEETDEIGEAALDAGGRRLLRRLESAGLVVMTRHESLEPDGSRHVSFSYHLSTAPRIAAAPAIQRALDLVDAVYRALPDDAWHRS